MIQSWSSREQHPITKEIGHMFAVSMSAASAREGQSALIVMRCLLQESFLNRISKIDIMGTVSVRTISFSVQNTWSFFLFFLNARNFSHLPLVTLKEQYYGLWIPRSNAVFQQLYSQLIPFSLIWGHLGNWEKAKGTLKYLKFFLVFLKMPVTFPNCHWSPWRSNVMVYESLIWIKYFSNYTVN